MNLRQSGNRVRSIGFVSQISTGAPNMRNLIDLFAGNPSCCSANGVAPRVPLSPFVSPQLYVHKATPTRPLLGSPRGSSQFRSSGTPPNQSSVTLSSSFSPFFFFFANCKYGHHFLPALSFSLIMFSRDALTKGSRLITFLRAGPVARIWAGSRFGARVAPPLGALCLERFDA